MLTGTYTGLRAIERNDLSQLLEWRNQPEFRLYFREFRELNAENQNFWFEKYVMQDSNTRMFAIVDLETNELIGACGLCYIDWINRNADFSIYIGKEKLYIDEKYAIDAGKIMEQYGFGELNLHKLWAEIYSIDKQKKCFFEKLSFMQEGYFKDTHWTQGEWVDSIYFAKINNWEG
ncbi:GNAT family N-acetyltransferase [Viridibacillus sp. YIM B01967]|uniref:GNAT family N-acetyltransferase n=1 Tax=Viridibacillus soli TaxID=2798301 RepID=A0ABS1H600_9BACL|nr:GNAT family protein [Viridibacillus soli]MBK3494839.1 GNAT family N-acetyltransferase [Viridibacillus soli]